MKNVTYSFYYTKTKKRIHQLLCLFALTFTVYSTNAATITSTAAGGNWNATGTWEGGVVPGTGDAVIIATTGGNSVLVNVAVTQIAAGSVTINNLGILATSSQNVTFGALTIQSGGTFNSVRNLIVLGTTIVSGTMNLATSSTRTDSFQGDVIINSGATWTSTGSARTVDFQGNFSNNATTFTSTDTGNHTFSGTGKTISGSTITSIPKILITGTRSISSGATLTATTSLAGPGTLTNNGTLAVSGSGVFTNTSVIDNAGIINISGSGNQAITLANFTNTGTINLNGSGSIAGITNNAGGIVNLNSSGTIASFNNATSTSTLNILATPTVPTITTLTVSVAGNTVNYSGAGNQTVKAVAYSNLGLIGSGVKSILTSTSVTGNLSISGATASIATGQNISAGNITLGGVNKVASTYGSTSSAAANPDNTYFAATTGIITTTKTSQTITFGALASKNYGDANFNLTATASSGLSVTYTSSNTAVATISGSTVTIIGAGSTIITALQAGNATYGAAPNVIQTLIVNKIIPTVSVPPTATAITYGQTLASSTLSGGTASVVGTYTFTTPSTAPNTGTASQNVTFTPTDTVNYTTATTTVNVTVNKATPTISVPPTASTIAFGQTLASSTLSGGTASVAGTFAFTTPSTIPSSGTTSQSVTFTPTDITNYNTTTTTTNVTVSLTTQTITFGALTPVTYGVASYDLTGSATASSGLAVTYASSNAAVATISGTTITIVGAGSTNITASQAGDATYDPASNVIQTLTVNPIALTIPDAAAVNKAYTGTNAAVIIGTLTGIINADAVTLIGTGTFASVNIGTGIDVTSTSTLGGANATNYTLTQPTGLTADITKANQTITFLGPLKNYVGFADFIPPATSPSNSITYTSSNPAVATIVANQVHYVGTGVTTITASQASSGNYNAAPDVTQTLTVMPMPIATWNFWTSNSTSQTTKQASIFDAGLITTSSADYITRGAGVGASGGTSAFRSTGFPLTSATPTLVSTTNTDYFQITIKASTGKAVSLSTIDAYFYSAGASGPTVAFESAPGATSQFGYSLDGGTTVIPIGSPVTSTALRMGQIDVSGIEALQNVPASTTITLRYYASGQSNRGWGFGSPNPTTGATAGIAATDGLVIGGDVSDVTIWNGTTWSNGTPTASISAIIAGDFDTSINTGLGFTCKKLTVNSGVLIIKSGTTLTVQNQLINNAGTNGIIVEDTASLVQINDAPPAANKGNINYNRQTTPISNLDYTYWASPVAGFTLGGVSPDTLSDKYFSFDSSIEDWQQESIATSMLPGIGYIISGPETNPYMTTPTAYLATFTGVPNNGQYQITGVLANKSYLLGNPYPSALDADTFMDANQNVLDGTLYFWTHNTPIDTSDFDYSEDDYASYNRTGGVSTSDAAPNTGVNNNTPSGKIGSGQGFFATSQITPAGTTIDFNNSMRVGVGGITGDNSQFFKTNISTKKTIEKHRVWLDLTNAEGIFKQTLIGYITDATNEYDNRFDGVSFNGNKFVDFYSINQGKNLVIQGRSLPFDENDEVPLGFITTLDGSFTIKINHTDGLLENQEVFLEDKLTNTLTNLKQGNYTFNTDTGTFNDRFALSFVNKSLSTNNFDVTKDKILITKDNHIKVNAKAESIKNIKVYDTSGRQIYHKTNINSNEFVLTDFVSSHQVLVVKTTMQNGTTHTKKIVY